jgi:hypothetical protein
MGLDEILKNQNVSKKNNYIPKIVLAITLAGTIPLVYGLTQNKNSSYEKTIENNQPSKISNKEKITLNIDGKQENFTYSQDIVNENELNQGIVVWEKIMKRKGISYPVGHLYVFKDINSKNIVRKFAVSGGDLENSVHSINNEVCVLNKFEVYPDYFDVNGKVISKGGDAKNPWGYGRFYQYPVVEKGNIMKILSKNNFSRYTEPDKQKRYLHGTSDCGEYNGFPKNTIGCTRTTNEAMDFLEEAVNEGYFRLAYVNNIK